MVWLVGDRPGRPQLAPLTSSEGAMVGELLLPRLELDQIPWRLRSSDRGGRAASVDGPQRGALLPATKFGLAVTYEHT